MKTPLELPGGAVDPERTPTKFELLQLIRPDTRIPLARIRDCDGGHVFDELRVTVGPPLEGIEARLDLAPQGVCEELREVRAERVAGANEGPYPHRLICRRMRHVANTVGRDFPESGARGVTNPAFVNPADAAALGLARGDLVEITSAHDAVIAVAEPSDDVPPGVVSIAHGFGAGPGEADDPRARGASTPRLVDPSVGYDPITGMAPQSAIPVALRPVAS
jgi:anaerobic selenocysteine-containing dehydrogenase